MFKRRLILGLCIFLLFMSIAVASEPRFDVEIELNETIYPGESEAGYLVVTSEDYRADTHVFSNYTEQIVQQFDFIVWNGIDSIRMKKPNNNEVVLITGSQFYVDKSGTYYFESITNSSLNSTFVASSADLNDITLLVESDFIEWDYDDEFVVSNERSITLTAKTDALLQVQTIPITIKLNNGFQNESFEKNLKIGKQVDWTIQETLPTTIDIQTGTFKELGFVKFTSKSNLDLKIETSFSGNISQFISVADEQNLPRQGTSTFYLYSQIPSRQKVGTYTGNITFSTDDKKISYPLKIVIKDEQKPEFVSTNISTFEIHRDVSIEIIAKDNNDVVKAEMQFNNETYTFEKDQQVFTLEHEWESAGSKTVTFCIYDDSQNKVCESDVHTFKKLDIIQRNSKVEFRSIRIDRDVVKQLFNLTANSDDPIVIRLTDFDTSTNLYNITSVDIAVIDGNGDSFRLQDIGDTIEIERKGEIQLELRSKDLYEFSGELSLELPNYMLPENNIRFSGKFVDYEVPETYTEKWHDSELTFKVEENGDVDDSYYVYTIKTPITTNPDNVILPISQKEKEFLEQETAESINKKNYFQGLTIFVSVFAMVICLILGGITYYFYKFYPYVRWRFK